MTWPWPADVNVNLIREDVDMKKKKKTARSTDELATLDEFLNRMLKKMNLQSFLYASATTKKVTSGDRRDIERWWL